MKITLGSFRIFSRFVEIFISQGAPPLSDDTSGSFATGVNDTCSNSLLVSTTLVANLPPVSMTPAVDLPPVSMAQVAKNGNSFRLLHLKMSLKKKFIYMLTLLPKGEKTKYLKPF
jgi:hypothetical protein